MFTVIMFIDIVNGYLVYVVTIDVVTMAGVCRSPSWPPVPRVST
jgi:hypothetical protein